MPQFTGSLNRYPARALFTWYLALILIGAFVLALPISRSYDAEPIDFLDALFTSTSAACVTGLTVRSTPDDFSFFGQVVIAVLIQLGGIGIMTITTFITLYWTGRESLRQRVTAAETLGARHGSDLRRVLRNVVAITFAIEGIGALLLALRYCFDYSVGDALWMGIFHSVAAYCNAGFALSNDNLIPSQGDWLVNFTIMALIIVGGIGFPVMSDIHKHWPSGWPNNWIRLHLHTKLVLLGTVGLLVVGALMFLVLEWNNVLSDKSLGTSLLISLFQSTTTRTAGFNTVDIAALTDATLFMIVLLMLVGAAPCSTGGGFKVSTFMVLAVHSISKLKGLRRVSAFRRTIPPETVGRAIATVLLFAFIATAGLGLLLVAQEEHRPHLESKGLFLEVAFEVISALGTVGLSMGLTPLLNAPGKLLIILLMFIGRIGPISLVVVLSRSAREDALEYAKEDVLIG